MMGFVIASFASFNLILAAAVPGGRQANAQRAPARNAPAGKVEGRQNVGQNAGRAQGPAKLSPINGPQKTFADFGYSLTYSRSKASLF